MKKSTKDILWIAAGVGAVLIYAKGKASASAGVAAPDTSTAGGVFDWLTGGIFGGSSAVATPTVTTSDPTPATQASGSSSSGPIIDPSQLPSASGPITSPSQIAGFGLGNYIQRRRR